MVLFFPTEAREAKLWKVSGNYFSIYFKTKSNTYGESQIAKEYGILNMGVWSKKYILRQETLIKCFLSLY